MSVEALKELNTAFNEIDVNGTGCLTMSELKQALKNVGHELPNKKLHEIFKTLDYANDGVIHYSEFIAATLTSRIIVDEHMIWTLFNIFDVDKSGKITSKNLKVVLKKMGIVYSDQKIENIIKEVNKQNTGEISFEDFKTLMSQKAIF